MREGWKEYNLNEVFDFSSGLSKSRDQFGFGYGFLAFKDVFNNFFLPKELGELVNSTEKERVKCSIKKGDVFLTRTSETQDELGMSSVALKDYPNATFNGFTKRLRPNGNVDVIPEYTGFYFRSPKFRATIGSMSSMTTRASLNNEMMAALKIIVPPLPEQKAIAAVLSSLDNKIDLLHRQNKTLEGMGEVLFREWFVEGAEEDWEIVSLNEIVGIAIGRTPPRKQSEWFSEDSKDIKWVSIKDLGNSGVYIFNTSECLTKEAVETFNIPVIPANTVVLSFKMTVGRVGITSEPMLSNEAIAHFKFNEETPFSTEYLYYFLKTFKYESLGSTSSIVTSINSQMIKDFEIPIPNKELMEQFKKMTVPYFAKIKTNQTQIQTLEQLRDTLLPKLMSGEVRVAI